jgi:hypothetical protein
MTLEQLAELKERVGLRKRLAKKIAHDCFSDTKTLENVHAADKITDAEMKAIMREATDKCYDLVLDLCSPHGVDSLTISNSATRCPSGTTPKFVSTDPALSACHWQASVSGGQLPLRAPDRGTAPSGLPFRNSPRTP